MVKKLNDSRSLFYTVLLYLIHKNNDFKGFSSSENFEKFIQITTHLTPSKSKPYYPHGKEKVQGQVEMSTFR